MSWASKVMHGNTHNKSTQFFEEYMTEYIHYIDTFSCRLYTHYIPKEAPATVYALCPNIT